MATTVIDAFVIEFGLDHRQFDKGSKEMQKNLRDLLDDSKKSGKEIESQGVKTTEFFDTLKRSALGLLGVFFGGRAIKEFTGYITSLDAATASAGKTMNMTAQELSIWQGAMEQSGGKAESMTGSMQGLSGEMNRFVLTGQSSMLPVLNQLGVSLYDKNKQLKTSGQLMLELADAVKGMDPARANSMLGMIPGMNPDTVNLLLQGRKAMEQFREEARKAGGTTGESAEQAREYQKQMALLERSSVSLGRSLMTLVLPSLIATAGALTKLFQAWNYKPGSKEDVAQSTGQRDKLVSTFGSPRRVMEWLAENSPLAGDKEYTLALADKWYGPKGADEKGAAAAAAAGRAAAEPTASSDMARYAAAVAAVESRGTGGYSAMGPPTKTGDRAYGKYQVMGSNIGAWTQEALGYKLTPEQFLATPSAQDAVFNSKFGSYVKKYGNPQDAASAWFTGKPLSQGSALMDGLGTSGSGYVSKFNGALRDAVPGKQSSAGGVTIGQIVVNTQATDAQGIARDIKPAIERQSYAVQADGGLT